MIFQLLKKGFRMWKGRKGSTQNRRNPRPGRRHGASNPRVGI